MCCFLPFGLSVISNFLAMIIIIGKIKEDIDNEVIKYFIFFHLRFVSQSIKRTEKSTANIVATTILKDMLGLEGCSGI